MIKYCSVLKKLKFSTCSNVDDLENILCEKAIYKEENLLRSQDRQTQRQKERLSKTMNEEWETTVQQRVYRR